ncbi:MAG: hypothetical protein ACRC2U_09345 [Aeromonas sp.]
MGLAIILKAPGLLVGCFLFGVIYPIRHERLVNKGGNSPATLVIYMASPAARDKGEGEIHFLLS